MVILATLSAGASLAVPDTVSHHETALAPMAADATAHGASGFISKNDSHCESRWDPLLQAGHRWWAEMGLIDGRGMRCALKLATTETEGFRPLEGASGAVALFADSCTPISC